MDTKWKKSKAVCCFLSFALGVSLLLTSLLPLAGNLCSESGRDRLRSAFQSDFQETEAFRSYLSEMMGRFIAMGTGGPLDGYSPDYYETYGLEDAVLLEANAISVAQEGEVWYFNGYPVSDYQPTESDKEQWKKEAEAWNKSLQEDQNLLYSVSRNGKVLYSNTEDISRYPTQGYSFLFSFDGKECSATRNGSPINLYGDGVYREDGEHWLLPGYSNFPAGNEAEGVRVSIAVADQPALYLKGSYGSQRSQWQCNRLYYLEKNWRERHQNLVVYGSIQAGVGLCLLAVWFLLRKEKPLADRAIARFTGHIWFEVKLLLLLGAVFFALSPLTEEMRYLVQEVTYAVSWEEAAYYQYPWFLSSYLYEVLRQPYAILTVFWTLYLFFNDLRYGDKPWRQGILGMLRARGLKLPIQRRLIRRYGLLGLGITLLGAELISLLILQTLRVTLPRWAIWNLFLLPLLLVLGGYLWSLRGYRQLAADLGALADQITSVRNGDLTAFPLPADSDLGKASQEVADIQQGMARAVEEQTRSERMKVELVTNVSHDIKTPLTSIISYAELLKQEELEPPAGEYVDILVQKAERLRSMVLDVFEISKATSGELPVKLESLDLAKLLRQTTADMTQAIESAPVTLRECLPEEPVPILADGDRLYRVFQNLLQNALTYALEGSRVYLSLTVKDGMAEASVKNTSKTELPDGVDFTARFVRGDQSRTDGGSGLGLAIADSFTRACGGELRVEPVADLFVVTVTFPLFQDEAEERDS